VPKFTTGVFGGDPMAIFLASVPLNRGEASAVDLPIRPRAARPRQTGRRLTCDRTTPRPTSTFCGLNRSPLRPWWGRNSAAPSSRLPYPSERPGAPGSSNRRPPDSLLWFGKAAAGASFGWCWPTLTRHRGRRHSARCSAARGVRGPQPDVVRMRARFWRPTPPQRCPLPNHP